MTTAIYTRAAFDNGAAHRTQRDACTDLATRRSEEHTSELQSH